MIWLLLGLATAATVEAFLRLPILPRIADLHRLAGRVIRVLSSSRISDHWKERVLPRYARQLFSLSIILAGWMALSLVPFFVIGGIAEAMDQPVLSVASTGAGVGLSILVAIGYWWLRRRRAPKMKYDAGARLLHHLALGVPIVAEASFDLERSVYGRSAGDFSQGRHVFVSGLARAGTTVLMRLFYMTGAFASLTYRDMPFVLAPNLWARISAKSKKTMTPEERPHGDGILVDFDSPEAFEEVFWRVIGGNHYIRPDGLYSTNVSAESIAQFREYVALVLKRYGVESYLSKNNNNILRIAAIRQAFPNAIVLIPFRDPLQHAGSLLRQHRRFSDEHRADPFSKKYMTWLAHHEFGGDHRPFVFSRQNEHGGNPDTLDYWLVQWIRVYETLLEQVKEDAEGCVPVSYELLCGDPQSTWRGLKRHAKLDPDVPLGLVLTPTRSQVAESGNPDALARASAIYNALNQVSEEMLLR